MGGLFFKKIVGNKARIFLSAITISLVMFLSILFASVGVNSYRLMLTYFDSYPEYNYLYVDYQKQNKTAVTPDEKPDRVAIQECVLEHCTVSGLDFGGITAWIYPKENHSLIPGGVILSGSMELSEKSVLLGNSVLTKLNRKPEEFIGKLMEVNSEPGYIVTGVFDDSRSIKSVQCLVVSPEPQEPTMVLIHTANVSEVGELQKKYQELGHSVISFSKEIHTAESKIRLIECGFLLISLMIILVAAAVLWGAIRNFSEDSSSFLALLKAQGYLKKHYSLMIWMDSSLTVLLAIPLECGLSLVFFPIIQGILARFRIEEIGGMDINHLLSIRIPVFVLVCVVQIFSSFLASVLISRKIYTKSVCDILHEVNQ